MIIVGWGKDARPVANLGVKRCPNCNNNSRFDLHERATQLKLYFIPVARLNLKYFVACQICGAGYEVDNRQKDELLKLGPKSAVPL